MPLSDFNYKTWVIKSRLKKELQILDKEVIGPDRKIVLDAGSGEDDHYYHEFSVRGMRIVRMDICAANLKNTNCNVGGNNTYLLAGDVNHIPLADESVDILFLCEVLEHLNLPEQALSEAYRVLKKGGYLFVDVPWLHEVYRPLSAILLRNLFSFKHKRKPVLLLKTLYKNLDEIDQIDDDRMLQRTGFGSAMIKLARFFPTFKSIDPEHFIYHYYHGTLPEGNMHLQFRFPGEWAAVVKQVGFKVVKKTGAFITPPLFNRSSIFNLVCGKLESVMKDKLIIGLSQILIIVAVKA